ncbi:MFS transporter [Alicyclobacillus hesperidum]|uniref:MFS transporter n=1 Tax=Alicyclobacillus hesperidum TaxID=89784 RepID=A0AA37X723_9BACL|nr:MFS transporter [Alicyclobacillus hesperidum]GLV14649.1 MFS transporter [Alicyclobacillus hesperidum]
MAVTATQQKSENYGWMVLSVTSLGVLLTMLNVGSLNVALPVIVKHFHATATTANWILLSYMLFNTVFILIFGRIADLFGRRKLYIIGLSLFTIVSLLIGLSPNIWVILILRAIQAAGGAIVITNTTPLITDAFPEGSLAKGLGINVLVASVAQLLGPVVGGFFAATLGWQWVFWFNVPIGILGVIWAAITLRSLPTSGTGEHLDWWGNVLLFVALSGLIFGLSEGATLGWSSTPVLVSFAAFILLTPIFLAYEWNHSSPVMQLRLFGQRRYAAAYAATFMNAFARSAVVLLFGLFEQTVHQSNPFLAGIAVLPVTIGMILLSPVAGWLAGRFDARLLSSVGLGISGAGVLLLIPYSAATSPYLWQGVGMFFVGAGSALFMTPNTSSIMSTVDPAYRGSANGLRSMLQNMGQVMSTALSLTLVAAKLPPTLQSAIYQGNGADLPVHDLPLLTGGFRMSFGALLLATLLGVIASLVRGPRPAQTP